MNRERYRERNSRGDSSGDSRRERRDYGRFQRGNNYRDDYRRDEYRREGSRDRERERGSERIRDGPGHWDSHRGKPYNGDRHRGRDSSRTSSSSSSISMLRSQYSKDQLQGVKSILERDRSKFTLWDVKPKEFANVSAEKAKLLGLFSEPGPDSKPASIQDIINNPANKAIFDSATMIDPRDSIVARTVIISDIDKDDAPVVVSFINTHLQSLKLFENLKVSVTDHRHIEKSLIVTLTDYKSATVVLAMNQYSIPSGSSLVKLVVSRPEEYIFSSSTYGEPDPELFFNDSPLNISLTNIPLQLTEASLREKIESSVGKIPYLKLLVDKESSSKGVAIARLKSIDDFDKLNSLVIDQQQLVATQSCNGTEIDLKMDCNGLRDVARGKIGPKRSPTNVLLLLNLVDVDEMLKSSDVKMINTEIKALQRDVEKKLRQITNFVQVKVPILDKPLIKAELFTRIGKTNGFGKVYIKFSSTSECELCFSKLHGTKYHDRIVLATYFSEQDFDLGLI